MKRWLLIAIYLGGVVPFLLGMGLIGWVTAGVVAGDPADLERDRILEILSKESIVYYADGSTQLGSLFGDVHRQYVPLRSIPQTMQDAVVASEDDSFFQHFGVDIRSTFRAAVRNVLFNRHEGASTITQQTVKNLFGRKKINYFVKLEEAIMAIRLENRYEKKEILEFYLNQFHVAGNGRGVGIAARYYFDKEVAELTLVEAAFIAGSVKAPGRYNPFIKRTEEDSRKARESAKIRKNYVLRRMKDLNYIDESTYMTSFAAEVPFKQGRFQFNELSLVDLVQRQLSRPEILAAVEVEDVRDMQSLGLHITTTVDRDIQNSAQYAVRQNLSRLQMTLSGLRKENESAFQPILSLEDAEFYTGRVIEVGREVDKEYLRVGFSPGISCVVPSDGMVRVAQILDIGRWAGPQRAKKDLMAQLLEGDYVFVSVRPGGDSLEPRPTPTPTPTAAEGVESPGIAATGDATRWREPKVCDLESRPDVEGGLAVLERGRVRALVGGFVTYGYNRAYFARRQPGSTFKTLTYYPALQLGWSPLDLLSNLRTVHKWQGQYYFPRPDHSPFPAENHFVDAAAKSENLASIWLLHHLTDKMTSGQFADLLRFVGLWRDGEDDEAFVRRMRARFGLTFDLESMREGVFDSAKNELLMDLTIGSEETFTALLRMMQYGIGFTEEAVRISDDFRERRLKPNRLEDPGEIRLEEVEARLHILRNNFLRWQQLAAEAKLAFDNLREALLDTTASVNILAEKAARFAILDGNRLAYHAADPFLPSKVSPLLSDPTITTANPMEVVEYVERMLESFDSGDIVLDGVVPIQLVSRFNEEVTWRAQQALESSPLDQLFSQADFRYSAGMIYAQKMCHQFGIRSDIAAVPSYPLGANVLTLTELALAYQTIPTGQTFTFFKSDSANEALIVQRIEDAYGNLIWEAREEAHQMVDSSFSPAMLGLLQATVLAGTAREADRKIILRAKDSATDLQLRKANLRVPTFGKTGTTNEYVNATYVGFLPFPDPYTNELNPRNMYTIASYVGFDTNKPMKKPGFRVTGSSGALPPWIDTAQAIVKLRDYATALDWRSIADVAGDRVPFNFGDGLTKVRAEVRRLDKPEPGEEDAPLGSWVIPVDMALSGRYVGQMFIPTRRVSLIKDVESERRSELEKEALPAEDADGGDVKEEELPP